MAHAPLRLSAGIQVGFVLGLTVGWLLALASPSLADYQPQGGDPPSGGSTTSGMGLH